MNGFPGLKIARATERSKRIEEVSQLLNKPESPNAMLGAASYDYQPADESAFEANYPPAEEYALGAEVEPSTYYDHAFVLVPQTQATEVDGISCTRCGEEDEEDKIILCSMEGCHGAICIGCLEDLDIPIPMPSQDYFCEEHGNPLMACSAKPCCRIKQPVSRVGIMCKSCLLPFHSECVSVPLSVLSEDWSCQDCEQLINTDHPDNEAARNPVPLNTPYNEDTTSFLPDFDEESSTTEPERCTESSVCLDALLALSTTKPVRFVILSWACQGFIMEKTRYKELLAAIGDVAKINAEQRAVLEKTAPPLNVVRSLSSFLKIEIKETVISLRFNGFIIEGSFFHRPLMNSLLQMVTSPKNRTLSRFESGNFEDCSLGGANYGMRMTRLVSRFLAKHPLHTFGGKPLILLLQLFSDESYTKYSTFHPIFLTLQNYDRRSRNYLRRTTNVAVGMVPQRLTFRITKDGVPVKTAAAIAGGLLINEVTKEMKLRCHQIILDEIKQLEKGYVTKIDNDTYDVRTILSSFVADLAGKREFVTCLPHANFWFCNHCYVWRGCSKTTEDQEIEEDNPLRVRVHSIPEEILRNRSTSNDNKLRHIFGEDRQDDAAYVLPRGKKKKSELQLQDFGVHKQTLSPLMENNTKGRVFLEDESPNSIISIDLLHNLSGCVKRLYGVFRELFGSSFDQKIMELGSKSFGNPNAFTNYKFQIQMYDFQFVTLALCEGSISCKDTLVLMYSQRISSQFLEIMSILKSEGALGSVDRLRTLTSELGKSIAALTLKNPKSTEELKYALEDPLQSGIDGKEGQHESNKRTIKIMTLKIHEIIEHTVGHLLEEGNLLGMDTMTGESLHPEISKKIKKTSQRHKSRDREALQLYTAHSLFEDLKYCQTPRSNLRAVTPFQERGVIRLTEMRQKLLIEIAFRRYLTIFNRKTGANCDIAECGNWFKSQFPTSRSPTEWSESIKCKIITEERNSIRYSEETFHAVRLDAKSLRVLSFGAMEVSAGQCISPSGACRFHNPHLALFPPSKFWGSAEHGFPIMFIRLNSKISAIVMKFSRKSQQQVLPVEVAQKYEPEWQLEEVKEDDFRDYLLTVQVQQSFFVFHASIKTFENPVNEGSGY